MEFDPQVDEPTSTKTEPLGRWAGRLRPHDAAAVVPGTAWFGKRMIPHTTKDDHGSDDNVTSDIKTSFRFTRTSEARHRMTQRLTPK